MVFRFLAVMVFGFLLLFAVKSLFDETRSSNKADARRPDVTSSVREPTYVNQSSFSSRNVDPQPPKPVSSGPKREASETLSPEMVQVRLQRAGAARLDRMVQFDSQPLEVNVNAHSPALAEIKAQPIVTEGFQAGQEEKIVTASASAEPISIALPAQERNASEPEKVPAPSRTREASVESLTQEQVAQIKSRLHDLGFLSVAKSSAWDTPARNALRDFKVANGLSNNDRWDPETSDKLNAQTAVYAGHSIIGNWSTAPCRSRKPTDMQLSISARRAKTSTGSVCEFLDLKATAREWRVKSSCSQGDKHWNANGKFALAGDKLTWTSERDVVNYFRCN